jgi:hypothetical protein
VKVCENVVFGRLSHGKLLAANDALASLRLFHRNGAKAAFPLGRILVIRKMDEGSFLRRG